MYREPGKTSCAWSCRNCAGVGACRKTFPMAATSASASASRTGSSPWFTEAGRQRPKHSAPVPRPASERKMRSTSSTNSAAGRSEQGARMPSTVTWLGSATLRIDSVSGKRIYVDPWLSGPNTPENERVPDRVDILAVTHGHVDHIGDTIELSNTHECHVVAQTDLVAWLDRNG